MVTLPKETLEELKLIAEKVMGWKTCLGEDANTGEEFILVNKNIGEGYVKWNPSGIHFYEVIGKLNKTLRRKLEFKLRDENDDYLALYHSTSDLSICLYVESHKAEIIAALIVILKEGKA